MDYQLWHGDCLEEMDRIICGDAALSMTQLPNECIDLTVTSPPYDDLRRYNGYTFDFEPIARQLWRVTKPGGVVVWVVADATKNGSESGTSFRQALGFMAIGFNLHDTMIYEAAGGGAKGSNYAYWQAFEFMLVLSKGKPKTVNRLKDRRNIKAGQIRKATPKMERIGSRAFGNRTIVEGDEGYRTNIWRYSAGSNGDDQTDHPAPFPEALARDHILSWSNPGDLVLDPLCGSGTTCKMALTTGRHYLGIDISSEYCEIATQRLARVAAELRGELNHLPMFAEAAVV